MSEAKFTKGEWSAKRSDGKWFFDNNWQLNNDSRCSYSNLFVGCNGEAVAVIPDYKGSESQMKSNASLIAAAPEMYVTLEQVCFLGVLSPHQEAIVLKLLAKARGES